MEDRVTVKNAGNVVPWPRIPFAGSVSEKILARGDNFHNVIAPSDLRPRGFKEDKSTFLSQTSALSQSKKQIIHHCHLVERVRPTTFIMHASFTAFVATLLLATAVAAPVAKDEVEPFAGIKREDVEPFAGIKRDDDVEPFAGIKRDDEVEPFAGIKRDDEVEPFAGIKREEEVEPFAGIKRDDDVEPFAGIKREEVEPFAGI